MKKKTKINKRRLVKVNTPLKVGHIYTEPHGESHFTALEC